MPFPRIIIAFNHASDGRPISQLVFYVGVRTNRNPHTLGPFVSNGDGRYTLDSNALQQLINDDRKRCPMDYGELRDDAFQQLKIDVPSKDVLRSYLKAMKLWGHPGLTEFEATIETCCNDEIATRSKSVDIDTVDASTILISVTFL